MFWISPRETPMINDKKVKIIREYFSLKREATEKQLAKPSRTITPSSNASTF